LVDHSAGLEVEPDFERVDDLDQVIVRAQLQTGEATSWVLGTRMPERAISGSQSISEDHDAQDRDIELDDRIIYPGPTHRVRVEKPHINQRATGDNRFRRRKIRRLIYRPGVTAATVTLEGKTNDPRSRKPRIFSLLSNWSSRTSDGGETISICPVVEIMPARAVAGRMDAAAPTTTHVNRAVDNKLQACRKRHLVIAALLGELPLTYKAADGSRATGWLPSH